MDYKKILIGSLGISAVSASMGGKKGLEVGLGLGIAIGFATGVTAGVLGSTMCIWGKNRIKRRIVSSSEE